MEAAAKVDRGGGKGKFMWRPACEGSGSGRDRLRQRLRQIRVEAVHRQICMEAGVEWRL